MAYVVGFNATFNNSWVRSWRKPEYPKKTTDMSQVTDELFRTVASEVKLLFTFTHITLENY